MLASPAAACIAELGHRVHCLEANRERLTLLQAGRTPIVEPGLDEIVARGIRSGRLRLTSDAAAALGDARIALLCVGTPPRAAGTPDLGQIAVAAQQITAVAHQRFCRRQRTLAHPFMGGGPDLILAVKSTVPPGTCEALEVLCTAMADGHHGGAIATPPFRVEVVSNPESLRESRAVEDFFHPDRLVVGAADPTVGRLVADLYAPGTEAVVCDRRSSELVKYAANTFLAVKISFANEVAELCERLGADVDLVLRGVGLDSRIGRAFLGAGPGFGGSCLPKDLAGFIEVGESLALATPLARAAQAINEAVCAELVDKLDLVVGGLDGARVGVLGLAFKPGTDDIRDSPAVRLVRAIAARGATVRACDPLASAADLPAEVVGNPLTVAHQADALVVATAWSQFAELDPFAVRAAARGGVLLDAVGLMPESAWRAAGFRVYGIGRGTPTSFHPVIWPPLTWAMADGAAGVVGAA